MDMENMQIRRRGSQGVCYNKKRRKTMQPKLKSILLTTSLGVILLLVVLSIMLVFVSGPMEKQRRDREDILRRVSSQYLISNPQYLNTSNFERSLMIGAGEYEGTKIYFVCDQLGNVLSRIAQNRIDVTAAMAFASKSMTFDKPSVRIAYFKGNFVLQVLEKKRETLLNIENYSVILTVETAHEN
jgi:hypothetical protein